MDMLEHINGQTAIIIAAITALPATLSAIASILNLLVSRGNHAVLKKVDANVSTVQTQTNGVLDRVREDAKALGAAEERRKFRGD